MIRLQGRTAKRCCGRRRPKGGRAAQRAPQEAIIGDREFAVADMQAAGIPAFVVRLRKNFTARRATPPPYQGRGRPPIHGELVRPLARRRGARQFPATPADQRTAWEQEERQIRAEQWTDLVLPDAPANAPRFSVTAIFDPQYHDALVLATPLPLSPRAVRDFYRDRWPIEQLHGRFASARQNRRLEQRASLCMNRRPASGCPNSLGSPAAC